jgi:hypothetical protein
MVNTMVYKKDIKEFVKTMLGNNQAWAINALNKIFEFQDFGEQETGMTKQINYVGFTCLDAEILTSFQNQYKSKKYLSNKQINLLMKKMPKYWKQIVSISDQIMLEKMVEEWKSKKEVDKTSSQL